MMWAMEYNPNIFSSYEMPQATVDSNLTLDDRMLKQCGKFQRKKVQNGRSDENNMLLVFLVASILETKNKKILKEARGLDDIVSVLFLVLSLSCT